MSNGEFAANLEQDPTGIGRAVSDVATAWDARIAQEIARQSAIFALRGAGSTNGIDPEAASNALDILVPRIEEQMQNRPVAIMYDGDPPNPEKPDIGQIASELRRRFDGRASFLAAQRTDWYGPAFPGANLTNRTGQPFETFVFPPDTYKGDHNRFTQSGQLAAYEGYGQIYVGAAGMLATEQMLGYLDQVPPEGRVNILVVRALINQALDVEIGEKLAQATTDAQRAKFAAMQEQRRSLFGSQWNNNGEFNISILEAMKHEADTHELVVLWDGPEQVDIVNCAKIDLESDEVNELFGSAGHFVRTKPITARQVPAGTTELVIVKSGATRDTANGGDWVCTSVGTKEEYVVRADQFGDIWEHEEGTDNTFKPRHDPRKLVKLDRDVIFMAAWGEKQAIRKGGYLMERTIRSGPNAGKTERYGIAQKDVDGDFVPA
ncbi:MAG TPA: hypothetical protein VK694_02385 [Verrucomicrobiae bacterium]|nr:hypothetical protein [Verrucomicrobiae bacterium]